MAKIPVVYVAGPYRGDISLNIDRAKAVGMLAAQLGWSPVIPHANTAHFDTMLPEISDEFWLEATLEIMRRCDAVVLVPGWESSIGAVGEKKEAERLLMPVFDNISNLPQAMDFLESLNHACFD